MSSFTSLFARDLPRFLAFKRARGHPYQRAEFTLRSFDRYVAVHHVEGHDPDHGDLVRGWLARRSGRKPVSIATELGPVRQFFLYLRRADPSGFVPGREFAPQSTESDFIPHVLTIEQVRGLLDAAGALAVPDAQRAAVRCLLLVLYCTGLRIGEAARLRLREVDLDQRVFFIAPSKGKSRLVPFRADLAHEIRAYRSLRDHVASTHPDDVLLVWTTGRPMRSATASNIVRRLLRQLGLKPPRGRSGPRPYDLRHTFAVHRLTQWHRAGIDVHSRLPWLSAYLGHDDLLGTEAYLRATPELMRLSARRFRARLDAPMESS